MSHYLALKDSRYRFSHNIKHFPIKSLCAIINGEQVKMRFLRKGGANIPYCQALDYIHRPKEPCFEEMHPYDFFRNTEVIDRNDSRFNDETLSFDFCEAHPKYGKTKVAFARNRPVLRLDWNFFNSAKKLTCIVTNSRRPSPARTDEEYCKKILCTFSPYREAKDLKFRESYQAKFARLHAEGKFDSVSFLLQNIQDIRNSLDAGRISDQILVQFEEDDSDESNNQENPADSSLQETIENCLLDLFEGDQNGQQPLQEEPTSFNLPTEKVKYECDEDFDRNNSVLQNVIEFNTPKPSDEDEVETMDNRYVADSGRLNCLLRSSFIDANVSSTSCKRKVNPIKPVGSAESIISFGYAANLDLDQQTAFEILTATCVLSYVEDSMVRAKDPEVLKNLYESKLELLDLSQFEARKGTPLRMFITGPAGAGKSSILDCLTDYMQKFCQSIGCVFDSGVIRLSALTGSAATGIKGTTLHKECKIGLGKSNPKVTADDISKWKNTRLLVIDEISFAGYKKVLMSLADRLQELTEDTSNVYGAIPIVFIGDFLQLEPLNSNDTIYKEVEGFYWEVQLNVLVELKGMWRFKNCKILQGAFESLRKYGVTQKTIELFNQRVIGPASKNKPEVKFPDIRTTKIATHTNKTKQMYNDQIFMDHLSKTHSTEENEEIPQHTVIIKGDLHWKTTGKRLSYNQRNMMFHKASEANTTAISDNKKVGTLLKLFHNCSVMTTENENVGRGVANGTTALFEKIVLKDNKSPHKIQYNGYWVYAVNAEDVSYMKLRWTKDSAFQGTFTIGPKQRTCISCVQVEDMGRKQKMNAHIDLLQFPITVNHATTGHKLQGKTVDKLLVGEWATHIKNWVYVVLSRVQTFDSLFLKRPIPASAIDPLDENYTGMMERLREKIGFKGDSFRITEIRNLIKNRQKT